MSYYQQNCWFVIHSPFLPYLSCRNVAIIKSNKDNRYGLDSVATHDGVKLPCCALPNLSSFRQKFGQDAYDQVSQRQNLVICLV